MFVPVPAGGRSGERGPRSRCRTAAVNPWRRGRAPPSRRSTWRSCRCSPGSVASSWAWSGPGSDPPSRRWSSTPGVALSSRCTGPTPRGSPMSASSTQQLSLWPTCGAEGSPARTSAAPTPTEPGSTAPGPASGSSSTGSSRRSAADRALSSSRTSVDSLGGAWTVWLPGSTTSATKWRSPGSSPPMWELLTAASGASLSGWPTATCGDAKASGSRNTPHSGAHSGQSLTDAVRGDGGRGRLLPWSTVVSSDWKSRSPLLKQDSSRQGGEPLREQVGKHADPHPLNPEWVETLQGFPGGWTELDPELSGRLRAERRKRPGKRRAP